MLVAERGDKVRIRFVNNIAKADLNIDGPQPSNVHTHGMAISPQQPADNAYIGVDSGATGTASPDHPMPHHKHQYEQPHAFPDGSGLTAPNIYEFRWTVPKDHAQGLHWYHPHAHGLVEHQVLSGMSGLLVIDGFITEHYPELDDLGVRRLILKDIVLPGAKDGDAKTKTINGVAGGVVRMRPGEHQIWEVGNVGADAFFDLAVDGHAFTMLGHDGNILIEPAPADHAYLPVGARSTMALRAGKPGRYAIRSRAVDTGPAGDPNPGVQLATLIVEGDALDQDSVAARLKRPADNRATIQPTVEAVRALPVTRRRTITFSENSAGTSFFINWRQFDANRDDVSVKVGDVEEWTILNTTGELHVFHIHQLDFLVLSINDADPDARGLRDTIDMPFARAGKPGKVVIKIPFTNPEIVGRFPFHCHILEHEDAGMMATVRVIP